MPDHSSAPTMLLPVYFFFKQKFSTLHRLPQALQLLPGEKKNPNI